MRLKRLTTLRNLHFFLFLNHRLVLHSLIAALVEYVMKSWSLLLGLLVTLFARLAIAEVLVSGAAMLREAGINNWSFSSLRATASTEVFLTSEFQNINAQLRPERFYRKKNGRLYQFSTPSRMEKLSTRRKALKGCWYKVSLRTICSWN